MIGNPGRRALLLSAAAAMLVAGCRRDANSAPSPLQREVAVQPAPEAPASAPAPPEVTPRVTPQVTPPVTPQVTSAPVPTTPSYEHIAATFAGRVPSYWGLEAPNVLRGLAAPAAGIALTLDFCGGPGGSAVDHAALDMLQRLEVPATLFVNARWIQANRSLAGDLAAVPFFELANHGTQHLPLSVTGRSAYGIPGTQSIRQVYDEIMTNDKLLTEITGKRPRFFRPGTAFLDEVAAEICRGLGSIPAGFSINADGGATYRKELVAEVTAKARPGDIIISHGNQPGSGTAAGLAMAIPVLLDKACAFTTLSAAVPAS